ncbi:uncharacterized protein PFL1_04365 [Pseudozyma flocculosa PF-1]|uniref:Uncharacterized protein n=2 Tax=Pseudozyma flocculosa TaxID=84751 RepID=A0A5C3FBQ2_9BASI|nr:uncharacterized protein PFL1_04365 [Pseudozyma flocculosa PF-1]EPQ28038.1 hypothetical protein PFL1_04365 [Pseudozyma flocculosa PF-1]SPO41566.1 uncharacterized protein PSFLO_07048 [Pseudozyma flocculosa]
MHQETFNDKLPASSGAGIEKQDAQRIDDNAKRAEKGEPQVGGAAGRAQVASKDPKEFDVRGGPGSMGNKPVQDPVV